MKEFGRLRTTTTGATSLSPMIGTGWGIATAAMIVVGCFVLSTIRPKAIGEAEVKFELSQSRVEMEYLAK